MIRAIVLSFLISKIFSMPAFAHDSQKLQIVTTIKPISMLVYAIIQNKAELNQLVPDFASVHDYSFKPSDLEMIDNAQIIFRIDEHMETLLTPAFELLEKTFPLISLAEEQDIFLLSLPGNKGHAHGHGHGNTDLHIWTSPQNAINMAKAITTNISKIDPKNSAYYQKNFKLLRKRIKNTAEIINQELIMVKNKKYLVFHPSWQYFQKSFGLQKPSIIAFRESITPGAKTIYTIRKQIQKNQAKCLFSDPHVNPSSIHTLIENFDLNTAEIDVLASTYPINSDSYINWLLEMKEKILNCLN